MTVASRETGLSVVRSALIDTGTQLTLFDEAVATDLGLDLTDAATENVSGLGGLVREARIASVELLLLEEPELSTRMDVGFVPNLERSLGNLPGLDALEAFDFGLFHWERIGYLSKRVG